MGNSNNNVKSVSLPFRIAAFVLVGITLIISVASFVIGMENYPFPFVELIDILIIMVVYAKYRDKKLRHS